MISGTLNSETDVTQIEIQNEIKTTEIKKPVNKSTTSVKNSDLLIEKNAKECDSNVVIIKNTKGGTADSNALEFGKLFTVYNLNTNEIGDTNVAKKDLGPKTKKRIFYPPKYIHKDTESALEYRPDRNKFVAKVFSLTFVMLLITSCFLTVVTLSKDWREFFLDESVGKLVFLGAAGGMVMLNCKIMCSPCMRMFPCNIVSLIIAVFFMSLVAAYVTAIHRTALVIYAFVGMTITVFVCFIVALKSEFDFTKFLVYIVAVAITFLVLSFVVFAGMLITGIRITFLELLLLFIGTIINVVVLVMKLQLILGGETVALAEEDYALGAFLLYTSIVELFLKILQMLGIVMDEQDDDYLF